VAVQAYARKYPDLAPWLDRLGLFSVYSSVWFAAIYLLLMVSLVGCIIPRTGHYLRALRARPPATPRHLSRLPHSQTYQTDEPVDVVLDRAQSVLRARRFRTDVRAEGLGDPDLVEAGSVAAQRGYSREAGNLLFHIGLVVVLVGVAVGGLVGYRGSVIVSEGRAFSNTLTQYDQFASGVLFTEDDLEPFTVSLEQFDAEFETSGPQAGAPRLFRAVGTYTPEPGASCAAVRHRGQLPAAARRNGGVPARHRLLTGRHGARRRGQRRHRRPGAVPAGRLLLHLRRCGQGTRRGTARPRVRGCSAADRRWTAPTE
jgi:cytochrome c biogenesis protein